MSFWENRYVHSPVEPLSLAPILLFEDGAKV